MLLLVSFQLVLDKFNPSSLSFSLSLFLCMCCCRFPQLYVMGFQPGSAVTSSTDRSNLIQLLVKEYITFPILLSNKNFCEVR